MATEEVHQDEQDSNMGYKRRGWRYVTYRNRQQIVTSVNSEHSIIEYSRDEMSNRNCFKMIPLEFYSINN